MSSRTRFNKMHPALKHAAYSATTLLPGEDKAAFERLHRDLIDELVPVGALEEGIVADIASLVWRKQNLATFRIARLAEAHREKIQNEVVPYSEFEHIKIPGSREFTEEEQAEQQKGFRTADAQARRELGEIHQLIDLGEEATTIEGLMSELEVLERLDGLIGKHLKQLMMVRGVKSLSLSSSSAATSQIEGPRKTGN